MLAESDSGWGVTKFVDRGLRRVVVALHSPASKRVGNKVGKVQGCCFVRSRLAVLGQVAVEHGNRPVGFVPVWSFARWLSLSTSRRLGESHRSDCQRTEGRPGRANAPAGPANPALVEKLVAAPGAMNQVREYGVVLTQDEVALFVRGRAAEQAMADLFAENSAKDWFSSIELQRAGPSILSEPTVILYATPRGSVEARSLAASSKSEGASVAVRDVEYSRAQLADFGFLFENPGIDQPMDSSLSSSSRNAARALSGELRRNSAILGFGAGRPGTDSVRAWIKKGAQLPESVVVPGLPRVVFQYALEVSGDSSLDPCEGKGCSPLHAGGKLGTPTAYCSLGMGLLERVGNTEYQPLWSTAGHCWGPFDNYYPNGGTLYPGFFSRDSRQRIGDGWGSHFFSGSAIDAQMVATSSRKWIASNLVKATDAAVRITSAESNMDMVGLRVCLSGANSDILRCASVTDGATWRWVDGVLIRDLVEADYSASPSDSGGVVIRESIKSRAVGWHSADSRFFSPVWNVNLLGVGDIRVNTTIDRKWDFVNALYEGGLNRFADGNASYWYAQMNGCNLANIKNVAYQILASTEFRQKYGINTVAERQIRVQLAYRTLLGRQADPAGFSFWVSQATSESGWTTVLNSILGAAEFADRAVGSGGAAYDGRAC